MVASLILGLRLFAISWKGCCRLFLAALVICRFKRSVTTFRWPERGWFLVEPVCWYHFQMSAAVDFLKSVIWAASLSPFLARRAPISWFFFGESCWMREVLRVVIEVLKQGYYGGWRWFKIYVDKTRWHAWSHVQLLILATSMLVTLCLTQCSNQMWQPAVSHEWHSEILAPYYGDCLWQQSPLALCVLTSALSSLFCLYFSISSQCMQYLNNWKSPECKR